MSVEQGVQNGPGAIADRAVARGARIEALSASFRRHRFALFIVVALASTLFLPALLRREVFTIRDHFDYFQPLRWFTSMELRAGRLPLWNPYNASGEPWLANPQTGVFYPPSWLFVVLPFATAYMLYLLVHLVLLGCGAYLLFARKASQGAALVGAVALMFSGPVLSLLDVSNNLATLAWIPLVLWCAGEKGWRPGAFALAGAFLAGEPFFAAVAALLYVIVRRRRDVVLTGIASFGICAVQLLPFLAFAAVSDRAGDMSDALILRDSMPLRDWLRLAVPPSLDISLVDPKLNQHFIPLVYVGIAVLALAVVALTTIGRRRDTLGWLALIAVAGAIATGPAILTRLPLTLFRYPARLLPVAAIGIAALAVIGWERLRPGRRWVDLVIVLVVLVDLLPRAMPLLRTAPFRTDVVPYSKVVGESRAILRIGEIEPARRAAWISGYLNLYDHRFDTATAAPLASEQGLRHQRELVSSPTLQALGSSGVGFVVTKLDLRGPFDRIAEASGVRVYQNRATVPLAAYFSRELSRLRRVRWSIDTSHVRVMVDAPQNGIVVLRQQVAEGWHVTIDGKPARPLVVDGIYRGVDVSPGRHEIIWKYDPRSFRIGLSLTIVTLATLLLACFVKSPARRQS